MSMTAAGQPKEFGKGKWIFDGTVNVMSNCTKQSIRTNAMRALLDDILQINFDIQRWSKYFSERYPIGGPIILLQSLPLRKITDAENGWLGGKVQAGSSYFFLPLIINLHWKNLLTPSGRTVKWHSLSNITLRCNSTVKINSWFKRPP